MKLLQAKLLLVLFVVAMALNSQAQKFTHLGIDQTAADLEYMKTQTLKGEQATPYATIKLLTTRMPAMTMQSRS